MTHVFFHQQPQCEGSIVGSNFEIRFEIKSNNIQYCAWYFLYNTYSRINNIYNNLKLYKIERQEKIK